METRKETGAIKDFGLTGKLKVDRSPVLTRL
jgi:hypothetical protein